MAEFIKGELITAEKLNQISEGKGTIDTGINKNGSWTLGPYYMRTGGYLGAYFGGFWSSSQIFPVSFSFMFAIYKLENGAWIKKAGDSRSGSTIAFSPGISYDYGVDWGEGWYQIHGESSLGGTNFNDGGVSIKIRPWITNNVRGDYLRYFDQPDNSGNPMGIGTLLTAEILNSGRVITVPYINGD